MHKSDKQNDNLILSSTTVLKLSRYNDITFFIEGGGSMVVIVW
jgi:hypothetical protein